MTDDMRIRNLSPRTQEVYVDRVKLFARHFGKSPEELGPEEVRAYQIHLRDQGCSESVMVQAVAALRFLYLVTLGKEWRLQAVPYPKKQRVLPVVLSPEEVERFLSSLERPKYQAFAMTLYGTGLRLGEAQHLLPADVESSRGLLRVRQGKGKQDRYVMLPDRLLASLRDYWRKERLNGFPSPWLFPQDINPLLPVSDRMVREIFVKAAQTAGLTKKVRPHLLRHCFATHMIEAGTDVRTVQVLLGHRRMQSTTIYTHVAADVLRKALSPLDRLASSRQPHSS
jgi:site-specific recombinase XerD